MQNTLFLLSVLVLGFSFSFAEDSTSMTVDELFFGDYNKAIPMTPSEALKLSKEEHTIVIIFSEEMSPSAVEDTNDFLTNRGYEVTLASGFAPTPTIQDQGQLFVWVAGNVGGLFTADKIADGSAYVRIIEVIEETGIKPDPDKVVDLYSNEN